MARHLSGVSGHRSTRVGEHIIHFQFSLLWQLLVMILLSLQLHEYLLVSFSECTLYNTGELSRSLLAHSHYPSWFRFRLLYVSFYRNKKVWNWLFEIGFFFINILDWNSLHSVNSRLVFCSVTGFGQHGHWTNRPGLDLIVAGLGGTLHGDTRGTARTRALASVLLRTLHRLQFTQNECGNRLVPRHLIPQRHGRS